MKYLLLLFSLFFSTFIIAQETTGLRELYPVFPKCENAGYQQQASCFNKNLKDFLLANFKTPPALLQQNYRGEIVLILEVSKKGQFRSMYINAAYPELQEEMRRVVEKLPVVKPATYNGRPTYMRFRMPLKIPLQRNKSLELEVDTPATKEDISAKPLQKNVLDEYDSIKPNRKFTNPEFRSQLNIPLSHEMYSRFDAEMNKIGTNAHTASKPFLYDEVNKYYNFKEEKAKLLKNKSSFLGRKLWNEHLVQYETKDYWFTLDFALDLQLGKDFEQEEHDFTYNNTRAAIFQGGLGKNLNFYTVLYESQGRFAEYFNRYAESIKPAGGDPAIVPGRGIAKDFMNEGYDYPVAEGYISYTPSKYFNIQFGHGKNFIGDGYRSLLMSDAASPYPFLKLNTTFWKIKYTNTWMSLRDVRPSVTGDSFRTKYMANHYLSINITKRLNIGLFESVIWQNDNNRGFDVNYLNPVIFFRSIEFATGADGGNAIIGLSGKYKWSNQLNFYGQMVIDEFSTSDIFGGEKSWKNKLGFQLGIKYFDAFKVPNLYLQLEYNQVRPYTYSHNDEGVLNYGHNNQSIAHLWGANFREIIGIARYKKNRWYGSTKLIYGKRGFDFNNIGFNPSYGGNIYRNYEDRPYDTGIKIGQGNTTRSFYAEMQAGYMINPATNLKIYGSFIYRNFDPQVNTSTDFKNSTAWLNFGIRTDIFNWYYDY